MEDSQERVSATENASELRHQVQPEPLGLYVWHSFLDGLLGLLGKIVGFIIDIFVSLYNIIKSAGVGIYHGVNKLGKGVKSLAHMFRYNDLWGRLSFLFFGLGSLAHRQIVNGILFLAFEVGYIVAFILNGANSIRLLGSLGEKTATESNCIDDPLFGRTCDTIPGDNSVLILIFGILWIFSLFLFLFVWKKSIEAGYRNYRIARFDAFNCYIETATPISKKVYGEIEEKKLFAGSKKEAKAHFASAHEELAALYETTEGKQYGAYLLNRTIESEFEYYAALKKASAKKSRAEARLYAYDHRKAYLSFMQKAQKKVDGYYASSAAAEKAGDLSRMKSLRIKALDLENTLSVLAKRHSAHGEKIREQIRELSAAIVDLEKAHMAFADADSAANHSKYGKFNNYYLRHARYASQEKFYGSYSAIVEEYRRGLSAYEQANADNIARREQVYAKKQKDLADIEEKYAGIAARKQAVLDRRRAENERYAQELEVLKTRNDPAALADAKFKHLDTLKTIKGVFLALPSDKDLAKARKEDTNNVLHAYHRDYKALKTNYGPKAYANECAINYMIVALEFSYDQATRYLKQVHKFLGEQEIDATLSSIREEHDDYLNSHASRYDGKARTFKEQGKSLLDDNFHLTLLALPILGVLIFVVMPLILSILVGFTNFNRLHQPPATLINWVGWRNFVNLFNTDLSNIEYQGFAGGLAKIFGWTIAWAVIATFSNYFLGIIYALLINKKGIKFKGFWRFIFVLSIAVPQFISLIAISIMLKDTGAIGTWWNQTFGSRLGFGVNTANDALTTKVIIILVNIWIGIPYTILQTTGILLNIPADLYESSTIDGAGPGRQFFKITLPYIFFVTGPSLIQTFIGNINNFGVIYFLTGGAPLNAAVKMGNMGYTDLLITYIYKLVTDVSRLEYGLASAIGLLVFIFCAFISMIVYNRSSSVKSEDQFQ